MDAGVSCDRRVTITFVPTARTQLAVWASGGGALFATIALTEATAYRGLGNRPGAAQLNSGYRWPVGRRENVLPAWAGSRLGSGQPAFRRVVFDPRPSEGFAARTAVVPPDDGRDSPDSYYCLSFDVARSRREGLDAVSCASQFWSDKGRYLTPEDVADGYAEPEESPPGVGRYRPLSLDSAYPPRRDVVATDADHPDSAEYAADAVAAMPELDVVTLATPPDGAPVVLIWTVPEDWPAGPVVVSVEANTEGDYNDTYNPATLPTPSRPEVAWDFWALTYGYPYRGQPSVVFDLEIELPPTDTVVAAATHRASTPRRMGALDASLDARAIDETILDDPTAHAGSGADRLRRGADGTRVTVSVDQIGCVAR